MNLSSFSYILSISLQANKTDFCKGFGVTPDSFGVLIRRWRCPAALCREANGLYRLLVVNSYHIAPGGVVERIAAAVYQKNPVING